MSPSGTLITVVPAGSGTPEALAATAEMCERVGAALLHLHVHDAARLTELIAAVRERTSLLVRVAGGPLDTRPDAVSCALEDAASAVALHTELRERGIVAAYEITDLAQFDTLRGLLDEHGGPAGGHVHVELVMGTPGLPGGIATLAEARRRLPAEATFSASGVGHATLPVLFGALAAAGHLRVGQADTISHARGERAMDTTQLVARASGLARIAQRPPLDPDGARALLGVAACPVASA